MFEFLMMWSLFDEYLRPAVSKNALVSKAFSLEDILIL
jgi:hypothetical protein